MAKNQQILTDIDFWNGVSNSLFKLGVIPGFNPVVDQYEYIDFWRTQKRRCIEGYWQSGKWMPGPLYYYINFFHIKGQSKTGIGEELILPWLRDYDWEAFLLYEEARGFSGFADDPKYTCNRKLGPELETIKEVGIFDTYVEHGLIRKEDLKKEYIPAREYLRTVFSRELGKPLYHNDAKNMISIQARGGGKSFGTAGIVGHNFSFGGATDYDQALGLSQAKTPPISDTIIGAIDTKYTQPLISKVRTGYEKMPGETEYLGQSFASPLYLGWKGSVAENKDFSNDNGSVVYHRTFRNNPLAGNAGRPNLVVLDEIGFFNILAESLAGIEGSQTSQIRKNLVVWMMGTGGYVDGGSVNYVENVFRDPLAYNCLAFDDVWEGRGKIGYFVPVTHSSNLFKKGENNITDYEAAKRYQEIEREKVKKDKKKYAGYIINAPLVPSEAFLITEGTVFPTIMLKDHLGDLLSKRSYLIEESLKGWMKFDDQGQTFLEPTQDGHPIRNYPIGKNNKGVDEDPTGMVEIWYPPICMEDTLVPEWGRYIGGIDVVDKDISSTDSLFSIFIMDKLEDRLVAEFTGRTDSAAFVYEQARRLCIHYNASIMLEKNLPGLYTYFDKMRSTRYLAETPNQMRTSDTYKANTNTSKGINANATVIRDGLSMINDWLMEPRSMSDTSQLNLHTLQSPALIQEMIKYNPDGNFDRVSAMIMLMWHYNTEVKKIESRRREATSFLEHEYFANRGFTRKKIIPAHLISANNA